MTTKLFNVGSLLWLALILALAGSLKHLAAIFASVDNNIFMGWLQAVAIDAGLFALAYSIRKRKVDKRTVKPLWFGVSLFSAISIYGNLAYGLLATNGQLPGWITASKPYLLAASLPILVLFLSELLSDDRQHANEQAKKLDRKQPRPGTDEAIVQPEVSLLALANEAKNAKVEERRRQVVILTQEGLSPVDIAQRLDVSHRTVKRDISALNGQVAK